jgi:hypothetical protein
MIIQNCNSEHYAGKIQRRQNARAIGKTLTGIAKNPERKLSTGKRRHSIRINNSFQLHVPKLCFRTVGKIDRIFIECMTTETAGADAYNTADSSNKSSEDHGPDTNQVTGIETGGIGPHFDPSSSHRHNLPSVMEGSNQGKPEIPGKIG